MIALRCRQKRKILFNTMLNLSSIAFTELPDKPFGRLAVMLAEVTRLARWQYIVRYITASMTDRDVMILMQSIGAIKHRRRVAAISTSAVPPTQRVYPVVFCKRMRQRLFTPLTSAIDDFGCLKILFWVFASPFLTVLQNLLFVRLFPSIRPLRMLSVIFSGSFFVTWYLTPAIGTIPFLLSVCFSVFKSRLFRFLSFRHAAPRFGSACLTKRVQPIQALVEMFFSGWQPLFATAALFQGYTWGIHRSNSPLGQTPAILSSAGIVVYG